jgi:CheY-like chemotaxis protein
MNPALLSQIRSAYENLYDLIYLRSHPLIEYLPVSQSGDPGEKAWNLHHLLLQTIDELDPGPKAPVFSRAWRRYRLLTCRFVDGMDPQVISQELNISRRQYYREYNVAMDALAASLENHLALFKDQTLLAESADAALVEPRLQITNHEEILRREAALASGGECAASLMEVIQGVLQLVDPVLKSSHLTIQLDLPDILPPVSVSYGLLRQLLLSIMAFLANTVSETKVMIRAVVVEDGLIELNLGLKPSTQPIVLPHPRPWEELAALEGIEVCTGPQALPSIFVLRLATAKIRTILAIDDNADMLQLYQRYLMAHEYQVITTTDARTAVEMALNHNPSAILLDLMMPEVDGWDVIQKLSHNPKTRHIPVIVCSILPQRELALSLGAAEFLQKPIGEAALIEALGKFICT